MKRDCKLCLIGILLCYLICLVFNSYLDFPTCYARTATELTDIIEDGEIHYDEGAVSYTKDNTSNTLEVGRIIGNPDDWAGYIEFNTSSIPDAAIIDQVRLVYMMQNNGTLAFTIRAMQHKPSTRTNQSIYEDAINGTTYFTSWNQVDNDVWNTIVLDGAADVLAGNLTQDWFAVGLAWAGAAQVDHMYSSESAYDPYLEVDWHLAGDYRVNFTGLYYENGTRHGNVTVTAALATGNELFNVSGTNSQYYPILPILWQYSLEGGGTRRIYAIGNESLTTTTPDATYSTYQFTIRDYTNKLGKGTAYLEALRTVNGTDALIERVVITTGTPVPLNLVTGEVYLIRVRWYDGTYYTWGYYVTGSDTTETLLLRGIEFTDQAYTVTRFITVEAARPTATTITVNYNDTRTRTTWVNVTIRIRGGAVVATSNSGNDTQALNFGGLTTGANYIVSIAGEHQDIGAWGYSKIFDASETFPDIPALTGIITLGGIDATQIIGYTITIVTLLTFSYAWKGRGLLASMAVASFLSYLGWLSLGYNLLAVGWLFSIAVAILAEGRI